MVLFIDKKCFHSKLYCVCVVDIPGKEWEDVAQIMYKYKLNFKKVYFN